MHLKKARFAALCGVSRPSIGDSVKRGSLNSVGGLIDISDPLNLAYLTKHNAPASQEFQTTGTIGGVDKPKASHKPSTRQAMTKKMATIYAEELPNLPDTQDDFDPFASLSVQEQSRRRRPTTDTSGEDDSTAGLTDAEISETLRKPLYDARKAKMESEIKAVALDTLHRSLGEREYFDGLIQCLWQAMQMNYIDVAPKQAALVCKRLGMVGHELEVIEVLESDVKKRQDNVAKAVDDVLKMRLSNLVKIEEVEE